MATHWGGNRGRNELFTATTEAIYVLPSSTGQAVERHSPFSCSSSRAHASGRKRNAPWRDSRGWSLHLSQKNRIFMKSLEIQSLTDRE